MQLSETINVFPVTITISQGVAGTELNLQAQSQQRPDTIIEIAFDQQTAVEFLPILQHFIETGGLPK